MHPKRIDRNEESAIILKSCITLLNENILSRLSQKRTRFYPAFFSSVVLLALFEVSRIATGATPAATTVTLEPPISTIEGGLLAARPGLGHFIILNNVAASPRATIARNQPVQVIGESPTEDPMNIYQGWGSTDHLIWVHDKYLEGYSSTTTTSGYTVSGIVADGAGTGRQTGTLLFQNNEMLQTAAAGIEIAHGHDVVAEGNWIVSCGKDSFGNWFVMNFVKAEQMSNAFNSTNFYNNMITTAAGGLVRSDGSNNFMAVDLFANAGSLFLRPHVIRVLLYAE